MRSCWFAAAQFVAESVVRAVTSDENARLAPTVSLVVPSPPGVDAVLTYRVTWVTWGDVSNVTVSEHSNHGRTVVDVVVSFSGISPPVAVEPQRDEPEIEEPEASLWPNSTTSRSPATVVYEPVPASPSRNALLRSDVLHSVPDE
jgi:hypothetical protein